MRKINFVQPVIFGYQNKEEGGNFNEEFQLLYPAIAESIKNLIAGLTGTEVKNNYKSLVDFQTSNMFKQDFKVSLNIVEETFTSVVYSVTIHDIANKPWPMFSETKAAKVTNPSIGLPYFVGIEEKIVVEKPQIQHSTEVRKETEQNPVAKQPELFSGGVEQNPICRTDKELLKKVSDVLTNSSMTSKEQAAASNIPSMYIYYYRKNVFCDRITRERNLSNLQKIKKAIDQGKIKQLSTTPAENYWDFNYKLLYLQKQGIDVASLLGYGLRFLGTLGTKECVFTTEECVMLTNKLDALFDDYKSGKLRVVQATAKEIKNDTVKDIKLEIQPSTVSKLAGNPNNFVIPTVKPYTSKDTKEKQHATKQKEVPVVTLVTEEEQTKLASLIENLEIKSALQLSRLGKVAVKITHSLFAKNFDGINPSIVRVLIGNLEKALEEKAKKDIEEAQESASRNESINIIQTAYNYCHNHPKLTETEKKILDNKQIAMVMRDDKAVGLNTHNLNFIAAEVQMVYNCLKDIPKVEESSEETPEQTSEEKSSLKSEIIGKMIKFNKGYISKAKNEIKSRYGRNEAVISAKVTKLCFIENRRRLILVDNSMQKVSSLLEIPFSILKKVSNFTNPPSNEEQLALYLYLNDNLAFIAELENLKD